MNDFKVGDFVVSGPYYRGIVINVNREYVRVRAQDGGIDQWDANGITYKSLQVVRCMTTESIELDNIEMKI